MSTSSKTEIVSTETFLPAVEHECPAGSITDSEATKCACGASRAATTAAWTGRNSRRQAQVSFFEEESHPWLTMNNRSMKTLEGIQRHAELLEQNPNLAGLIIANVPTERARVNYDRDVEAELNARFCAEARLTIQIALEVGAAHLLVRRGWRDSPTTNAHVVDGICLIIVDLPATPAGTDRCLP